jgi:hypothetical protein
MYEFNKLIVFISSQVIEEIILIIFIACFII